MFKQSISIVDDIQPTRSKSMSTLIIWVLAAGVVLAPLAVDAAAICYAQWCEVMGKSTEVRTPIIDSMGNGLQHARDSLAESIGPTFKRTLGDPGVALPVSSILVVLAMTMLRR